MKPPSVYYDQSPQDLQGRAVHDTALYDPAAHDDQIVVMFETRADAEAALSRLAAEGLAGDAAITDRTPDGVNAGINAEGGNTGLWGSLKGLFAPGPDALGFAEGVNRGHALLVIHPAPESRSRVVTLLEASNPIDFDARLERWRSAGWQALAEQQHADRAGTFDASRSTPAIRSYYAARKQS